MLLLLLLLLLLWTRTQRTAAAIVRGPLGLFQIAVAVLLLLVLLVLRTDGNVAGDAVYLWIMLTMQTMRMLTWKLLRTHLL